MGKIVDIEFLAGTVILLTAGAVVFIFFRIRESRRGYEAFLADLDDGYMFDGDAVRIRAMISVGRRLINRPLPEVIFDQTAFRIKLQASGLPGIIGIRRSEVQHIYLRRGVPGVGFTFKDKNHRADAVTIWCGSTEPMRTQLAERRWLW